MLMNDFLRIKYFVYCLFYRNGYKHAQFLRSQNAFKAMGERCFFQPYKLPQDAKLISIGNNVVIASDVNLICHDVIHLMYNGISGGGTREQTQSFLWCD